MRISVITATYNAEIPVARLVDSLNEQSFSDFEWILVDGGSNDKTLEVARRFRGACQMISERDDGIYDAWNKAVGMAKGEWLFFLGADDYLAGSDALGDLSRALPTTGIHNLAFFSTQLKFRDQFKKIPESSPSEISVEMFRKTMNFCHQGIAQKRMDLIGNGKFDCAMKVCGDYDAILASLRNANGVFLPIEPIAIMELGGISTTIKGIGMAYAEMAFIQKRYFGKSHLGIILKSNIFVIASKILSKRFCNKIEMVRNARLMRI